MYPSEVAIEGQGVRRLVASFRRPHTIACMQHNLLKPVDSQKDFISPDITALDVSEHRYVHITFIGMRRNDMIDHRNPINGREGNTFLSKIVYLATGIVAVAGASNKITMCFGSLHAENWNRLIIKNEVLLLINRLCCQLGVPKGFEVVVRTCPDD